MATRASTAESPEAKKTAAPGDAPPPKKSKGPKGPTGDDGQDTAPGPITWGTRLKGWAREGVFLGVLVLAVLGARASFADHYYVPSGSMLPTVHIGDHLVVNKLAYGLRFPGTEDYLMEFAGPKVGDVVVLESPQDGTTLLKRVVGIPGDVIEVRGGKLSINGKPIAVVDGKKGGLIEDLGAHPHPVRLTYGGGPAWGPEKLGKDQYLVMGDNRGESHDGRAFGLVTRESILGRAIAIYWRNHKFTWRPFAHD